MTCLSREPRRRVTACVFLLFAGNILGSCGHDGAPAAASVNDGASESEAVRTRADEIRIRARKAVDAFYQGRLTQLHGLFDTELAESMDVEAFAEFSRHILETYGTLIDVLEQEVFERDGEMVYAASLMTSRSDEPVLFLTVWDSSLRITQIRILPRPRLAEADSDSRPGVRGLKN